MNFTVTMGREGYAEGFLETEPSLRTAHKHFCLRKDCDCPEVLVDGSIFIVPKNAKLVSVWAYHEKFTELSYKIWVRKGAQTDKFNKSTRVSNEVPMNVQVESGTEIGIEVLNLVKNPVVALNFEV